MLKRYETYSGKWVCLIKIEVSWLVSDTTWYQKFQAWYQSIEYFSIKSPINKIFWMQVSVFDKLIWCTIGP